MWVVVSMLSYDDMGCPFNTFERHGLTSDERPHLTVSKDTVYQNISQSQYIPPTCTTPSAQTRYIRVTNCLC
jgi:hypothetical protein